MTARSRFRAPSGSSRSAVFLPEPVAPLSLTCWSRLGWNDDSQREGLEHTALRVGVKPSRIALRLGAIEDKVPWPRSAFRGRRGSPQYMTHGTMEVYNLERESSSTNP